MQSSNSWSGVFPATLCPFHADESIDDEGLAEYIGQELVMQRFLMPVFFGNFAHDSQRLTFEQPAENWRVELQNAGFEDIHTSPIYDYWWGPAFLMRASRNKQS